MMDENIQSISLEKLKSNDRAEFAHLVDLFTNPIYRLAFNMLGDEQDAEDVLQETFIKVFRNLQGFEERASLSTWIYRIAVNEALMILRKGKKSASVIELDQEDEEESGQMDVTDWCCLPEEDFLTTEVKANLDKAVMELPEKLRVVFILRDIEDLNIKETAAALEITEMSVKTRLLRARLMMREKMTAYFGDVKKVHRAFDGNN